MKIYQAQVLIIGSGPAGYSAAIYATRADLKPILIQGAQIGGQLSMTNDVENYPGFSRSVQGPWLMQEMQHQAERIGCKISQDHIITVKPLDEGFIATGENNKYFVKAVIITTGAQAKWLGMLSEKKFMGYGVSSCATCDAFFYKDKNVLVVGGGNTAVEEALYLAKYANTVFVIHRRKKLRADIILQKRLFANKKIRVIWSTLLVEIFGTANPLSVSGVLVHNVISNFISKIKVDGVFIAIGHIPNTKIFENIIEMDSEGYIITKSNSTVTSIKAIYAAGDVQDKVFRQAITAAGSGCMAALEANFIF